MRRGVLLRLARWKRATDRPKTLSAQCFNKTDFSRPDASHGSTSGTCLMSRIYFRCSCETVRQKPCLKGGFRVFHRKARDRFDDPFQVFDRDQARALKLTRCASMTGTP